MDHQKKPTNVDTTALVESVQTDMLNIEKGNQWLFSSYSPFKDKTAFPGFTDDSFEELRAGFYEARNTGNGDAYFHQLQAKQEEAMAKVKKLREPTADVINALIQVYNTPASITVSSASGTFGNTANSAFPAANQSWATPQAAGSIFGGNANFTNQTSLFGNAASSNVFAKPVQSMFSGAATSTNIFGKSTTPSVFGQSQSTGNTVSIFGGSGSSVFGSTNVYSAAPTQPSIFSSSNTQGSSIFSSSNAPSVFSGPSIFASPQTNPAPPIFGSPSAQAQNPAPSVFGSSNSQSGFGSSNAPATSVFGQQAPFLNPQPQQNIFANSQATLTNVFGGAVATSQAPIFAGASPNPQTSVFNSTPFSNTSPFAQNAATAPSNPAMFGQLSNVPQMSNVPVPQMATSAPIDVPVSSSPFLTVSPFSNPGVFGGGTTNVFDRPKTSPLVIAQQHPEYYSLQLTEEHLKAFQCPEFKFGLIPDVPPTVDLCI